MLLTGLVEVSGRVAATRSRRAKVGLLAELLRRLHGREIEVGVEYLAGRLPQGRLGVGWATVQKALPEGASERPTLALLEVDERFTQVSRETGAGSQGRRVEGLVDLFRRATREEQSFLARLLIGEVRQGALEGVMAEAIAEAAGVPPDRVRRAVMLAGTLGEVAAAALGEGEAGLARYGLRLFRPVQPMLARTAEDVAAGLAKLGRAAFEAKLDGARVQVHREGEDVRVFSRRLNDVTAAVPEVVEAVRGLPVRRIVLDGEALALRADGRPHPFQVTMRRFGRRLDVERMREELPLSVAFFDCLLLDDDDLLDRPSEERWQALATVVPQELAVARTVTDRPAAADEVLGAALAAGHEGVMAKSLAAPYEAGVRGSGWLKIKRTHTLDLVVLAAEWGHGRRRGRLSNLHLGARDAASGGFVMLGKTFKGLTDEMLAWQTERLLELETSRDRHIVRVEPRLVVEVAFDGVQESPQYPGGLALRFARVRAYRPDKSSDQADTLEAVEAIHLAQLEGE